MGRRSWRRHGQCSAPSLWLAGTVARRFAQPTIIAVILKLQFQRHLFSAKQEKLEAARAMQRAIIVASNSTAGIAAVAANFEKLQVWFIKI